MYRPSPPSTFHNQTSNPDARPARTLDHDHVNSRFYGHDESRTSHPHRFDPTGAQGTSNDTKTYARQRNKTTWAHALILFNTLGIPFSQGVWLEQRYINALNDKSLVALAVIPGLQLLFLLSTPLLVGSIYHIRGPRSGWRITLLISSPIAVACQLLPQWLKNYIPTLFLTGPITGIALGTLFILSTLVLSSHYKSNIPLVSMQSWSIGYAGALVYTLIAKMAGEYKHVVTAGVMAVTLGVANVLISRVETRQRPAMEMQMPSWREVWRDEQTLVFVGGYVLVFFGIFGSPIYITLHLRLDTSVALCTLLATFGTAAMSASMVASRTVSRRLGPVNTFVAGSVFAGAVSILPVWMPRRDVAIISGAAYGIGLGAMVALHVKVASVFSSEGKSGVWHADMPARAAIAVALGGVSAFVGLLVNAVVIESIKNGARIASAIAAGAIVVGGALVAVARWRRCSKIWVAI